MTTLARRRNRNIAIMAVAILGIIALDWVYRASLHNPRTLDGWLLVVAVLVLTFFNLRKKIPVLPLFSAAAWLEFHAYFGITALAIFVLHAGIFPPRGQLEAVLWFVFLVVAITGLFGLWLSRTLPGRIRQRGETILFDRIPVFRRQLSREVEDLVKRSVGETTSSVIADLYVERLAPYFAKPRNVMAHLVESTRPINQLRREIHDRQRYLNPEGRSILATIDGHITTKDDLDYQYALHMALRAWLFVHVPLTYGMLLLIVCHVILVYGLGRV